jgi:broad specificity phosphatase PhoE
MWLKYVLLVPVFYLTACSHTYYVVRHAEKAAAAEAGTMMANDPPLTTAGQQRAQALKDSLMDKHIHYIFSTNTVRTKTTAEPLRVYLGLETVVYNPRPDSAFIAQLKHLKKNTLVVGHSNTVDDIVNGLCPGQSLKDLADSEYDNLFVVTYKKKLFKKVVVYQRKKYGALSK